MTQWYKSISNWFSIVALVISAGTLLLTSPLLIELYTQPILKCKSLSYVECDTLLGFYYSVQNAGRSTARDFDIHIPAAIIPYDVKDTWFTISDFRVYASWGPSFDIEILADSSQVLNIDRLVPNAFFILGIRGKSREDIDYWSIASWVTSEINITWDQGIATLPCPEPNFKDPLKDPFLETWRRFLLP